MGAVLTTVQMLALAGGIWNQIETKILQQQLKDLYQQHKSVIDTVAQLCQLMQKITFTDNLFTQLDLAIEFSLRNWEIIAKQMAKQTNLVDKISKKFLDKLAALENASNSGWTAMGLNIFGFVVASIGAFKLVAPQLYKKIKGKLLQHPKNLANKVKNGVRKLKILGISGEGKIYQTQITPQNIQAQNIKSQAKNSNLKSKLTKVGNAFMTLVRLGLIVFLIYSFAKGRIHIQQLKQQIRENKDYFSNPDKFQKQLKDCAEAVKIFGCDIYNLSQGCRVIVEQFHNLYLVKSLVQGTASNTYAQQANEYTLKKFGLTDDFIDKCELLKDKIKQTDQTNLKTADKLQKYVDYFKDFFNNYSGGSSPQVIFARVTQKISDRVGKQSTIFQALTKRQSNLYKVAEDVQDIFQEKRQRSFKKQTSQEKKKIDLNILNEIEKEYRKKMLDDKSNTIALRKEDHEMIFGLISNFCDGEFYAHDLAGKKVYHINIDEQLKIKTTFQKLLNDQKYQSQAQVIPVSYQKKETQLNFTKEMIESAIQLGKTRGLQDFTNLKPENVITEGRYLRLRQKAIIEKPIQNTNGQISQQDIPKIQLIASNGIRFKVHIAIYTYEKQIISGRQDLRKA